MEKSTACLHKNQHTEGAGVRWCSDCGRKEPNVNRANESNFAELQRKANKIEARFDSLRDELASLEQTPDHSEKMASMRQEMAQLSEQYHGLTGLTLE